MHAALCIPFGGSAPNTEPDKNRERRCIYSDFLHAHMKLVDFDFLYKETNDYHYPAT